MEINIFFPIGEFEEHSAVIKSLKNRFIDGILSSLFKETEPKEWLLADITTRVNTTYDGRTIEAGQYVLQAFRVNWNHRDSLERLGVELWTRREENR